MASSDIYRHGLLVYRHGLPLWKPSPNAKLPPDYVRNGISIGDLGLLTDDGGFDFLFNVHAQPTDSVNRALGTPPSFIVMDPLTNDEVMEDQSQHRRGALLLHNAEGNVAGSGGFSSAMPGVETKVGVTFTHSRQRTAILFLPDGGVRLDAKSIGKYISYAVEHAVRWYQYVNEEKKRMAKNNTLFLVTGVDKCPSWALAAGVPNTTLTASFTITAVAPPLASGTLNMEARWSHETALESRLYPETSWNNPGYTNQCVFLRGLTIGINETVFKRFLGISPVGIRRIDYACKSLPKFGNTVPTQSSLSRPSVMSTRDGQSSSVENEHQTGQIDEYGDALVEDDLGDNENSTEDPDPAVLNPGSYICRYVLDMQPNIDVVVVHDNDWITATETGTEEIFTSTGTDYDRLVARVLERCPPHTHVQNHHAREDAASLTGNFTDINSNTASSSSRPAEYIGEFRHYEGMVETTLNASDDVPNLFTDVKDSYIDLSQTKSVNTAFLLQDQRVYTTKADAELAFISRFQEPTNLKDIDNAISHHLVLAKMQHGDQERRNIYRNIAVSYAHRASRTRDITDVESAIFYFKEALLFLSTNDIDYFSILDELGYLLLLRFLSTADVSNHNEAISIHQKVLDVTQTDHPKFPIRLNNLGTCLLVRSKHDTSCEQIDTAILYLKRAIEHPYFNIDHPTLFNNLGNAYARRFSQSQSQSDLIHSITSYQRGAKDNGISSMRIQCAKRAALLSYDFNSHQTLNNLSVAIQMLSDTAGPEYPIFQRYRNLRGHSDFIGRAIAIAFQYKRLDLALAWLEQGRCLVWSNINQLHAQVELLRERDPALGNNFTLCVEGLESIRHTVTGGLTLQDGNTKAVADRIDEYRKLVEKIRACPGFEDFLSPVDINKTISSLPAEGSVVIFNLHQSRCDAIVLAASFGDPLHVPLGNFSFTEAETLKESLQGIASNPGGNTKYMKSQTNPMSVSSILKELWQKVLQPIIKALAYSVPDHASNRPRIWWCPTGPLASLPLHAAGIYGAEGGRGLCVSDYVVSSYTPTLRSISEKAAAIKATSSRSISNSILLVSVMTSRDVSPTAGPRNSNPKLKYLMQKSAGVETLRLVQANATREKVKQEMTSHGWSHFDCFGLQDRVQALQSGLRLHDGRLTLLDLMQMHIPNAGFAFLAASESAQGDSELPEEAVHFAAGMLSVGYSGVVGTMWGVSDDYSAKLSQKFYQFLIREGKKGELDSSRAAYALDYATAQLKGSGDDDSSFMKWVPYVHFGY